MKKLLLVFCMLLTLVSCGKQRLVSDVFIYRIHNQGYTNEEIQITDLTDEGKTFETIVFPSEISGKNVALGSTNFNSFDERESIGSSKLKHAIIKDVKLIYPEALNRCFNLKTVSLASNSVLNIKGIFFTSGVKVYLPFEYYQAYQNTYTVESTDTYLWTSFETDTVKSRVSFYIDDSIYWISADASGQVISEPLSPTKDDKTFIGWYDEENNLFSFDQSSLEVENLKLYAKWQ